MLERMMTHQDFYEVLAYIDMRDREPTVQEVLLDYLDQLEEAKDDIPT